MKYLHDKQHYFDLYDLFTIKSCLDTIKFWQEAYEKSQTNEKFKNLPKKEKIRGCNFYLSWHLRTIKTERYQRKKETIEKWMEDGRIKQKKYDNALPPDIDCQICRVVMKENFRNLEDFLDEPVRVLFILKCPKCGKKRSFYDNGEEIFSELKICPKCKKELKVICKREKEKLIWTEKCGGCGYKKIEMDDFEKNKNEWRKDELEDKKLLEKYRGEFCLSDKEGQKNIELLGAMEFANEVKKAEVRKYDDPAHDKVSKLKVLDGSGLEKRLSVALEKEGYGKLSLGKPEMSRYVVIPFTLQDTNPDCKSRHSTSELKKLIKKALEATNWRLLTGSPMYRLGFMSGRLKGYEGEEDLLELSGYQKKEKEIKLDPGKEKKYGSHSMVQLARLLGQHEGVENVRKRRLAKEPNGFFLGDNGGSCACTVCGEDYPGNQIWWTPDALRCADCWRNIKEGVIPPLVWNHDNKIWIQEWQIKSNYDVHPMTKKKLERDGILHPKNLKRKDGIIYCTVYLVEENKEFLEKYPKIAKTLPKITIKDSDGGEIEL